MRRIPLLFSVAILFLLRLPVTSQEPPKIDLDSLPAVSQTKPSLPVLYRHFLAYQNHLDRTASDAQLRGQDSNATAIRNYHQNELGFTDSPLPGF